MPKVVDHDQYRKELLNQCFDMFAEKGYSAITMRQIAQGLGVSTGTLYHYFPNKEALFEQLVEEWTQQDLLRVSTELKRALSLAERIEVTFQYIADHEDYFMKQVFILNDFYQQQERGKARHHEIFKLVCERSRQQVADLLQLKDPNIVTLVLSLIDGLILGRLYNEEVISFAEQGALLGKMLTAYLEKSLENHSSETFSSETLRYRDKVAL
ncbi:MAG: TetR/AcrR family transcriptional regulator [Oculatellaceae cyanobacterium Prado106]|nr:TetR/AcrR family transcriptional regulator [Oculatellaceae cyanobacterium Prado106]